MKVIHSLTCNNTDVHFSFSMKEMGSGMGTESRLERSKGESRQDNIHLEPGNSHISNNEGESHSDT